MTGPEHYREAERLIERADEWLDADYGWMASMPTTERLERRASDLASAQVHATLALAAASALPALRHIVGHDEIAGWSAALGLHTWHDPEGERRAEP